MKPFLRQNKDGQTQDPKIQAENARPITAESLRVATGKEILREQEVTASANKHGVTSNTLGQNEPNKEPDHPKGER